MLGDIRIPPFDVISTFEVPPNEPPIVETVPRTVPVGSFVRLTAVEMNRCLTDHSATLALAGIRLIDAMTDNAIFLEKSIASVYAARGVSGPLIEAFNKGANQSVADDGVRATKQALFDEKYKLLKKAVVGGEEVIKRIKELFLRKDIWERGQYTDRFIDQLCLTIRRLRVLGELLFQKRCLVNDVEFLRQGLNLPEDAEITETIGKVVNVANGFQGGPFMQMMMSEKYLGSGIEPGIVKKVFELLFAFIEPRLRKNDFILPEMPIAYADTIMFLVLFYKTQRSAELKTMKSVIAAGGKKPDRQRKQLKDMKTKRQFCDLKEKKVAFIRAVVKGYQYTPAFLEFTLPIMNGIWPKMEQTIFKDDKIVVPLPIDGLPVQHENVVDALKDLSHSIAEITSFEKRRGQGTDNKKKRDDEKAMGKAVFHNLIPTLRNIGLSLNVIRVVVASCRAAEARGDVALERNEQNLKEIMGVLHACRSARDLINMHLPSLMNCLIEYMQGYIHEFVDVSMRQAIERNEKIDNVIAGCNFIRTHFGYGELAPGARGAQAERKEVPKGSPHMSMVELVRVQVAMWMDPESGLVPTGLMAGGINARDREVFQSFIEETRFFIDMLQLPDVVLDVCDISSLYFRECMRVERKLGFFPMQLSLPVILSNYVCRRCGIPQVKASMFTPVCIYDDAASTALRRLGAPYILDEIKVEARICVVTVCDSIAAFLYNEIFNFSSLSLLTAVSKDIMDHGSSNRAHTMRGGIILQQNELIVLGCYVDSRALIAQRVNGLIVAKVEAIVKLLDEHGILAIIAVRRLLMLMESTHEIMMGYGLAIMRWEDIVSWVLGMSVPTSFQSLLFASVYSHITENVAPKFSLLCFPHRLIPRKPIQSPMQRLGLPDACRRALEPTFAFVTLENFRSLFWYLDNGAIVSMYIQLIVSLQEGLASFCEQYKEVTECVVRIKDAPLATGCFQIFARFEGAYRAFTKYGAVLEMFGAMAKIGNIFALLQMLDEAFLLKRQSQSQNSSFFRCEVSFDRNSPGKDPDAIPELFAIGAFFDGKFQSAADLYKQFVALPSSSEIAPWFTYSAMDIVHRYLENESGGMFEERAPDFTDIQKLTGFAAKWSAFEFIFCLIETERAYSALTHNGKSEVRGAIHRFGEGVPTCAAIVMNAVGQVKLFHAISINRKIKTRYETDAIGGEGSRIQAHLTGAALVSSAFKCATATLQPVLAAIIRKNQA